MTDAVVLLCTCKDADEGRRIADTLVEEHLAACVTILPPVASVYRWEGRIERTEEVLIFIKSTDPRVRQLQDLISQLHRYETPEIIALPVIRGSDKYLKWLREETVGMDAE